MSDCLVAWVLHGHLCLEERCQGWERNEEVERRCRNIGTMMGRGMIGSWGGPHLGTLGSLAESNPDDQPRFFTQNQNIGSLVILDST